MELCDCNNKRKPPIASEETKIEPLLLGNKYLLDLFREWGAGSNIGKRSQLPGPVIIKLIEEIERLKGIGCLREQVDKEREIAELKHKRCDYSNCASRYIKEGIRNGE